MLSIGALFRVGMVYIAALAIGIAAGSALSLLDLITTGQVVNGSLSLASFAGTIRLALLRDSDL